MADEIFEPIADWPVAASSRQKADVAELLSSVASLQLPALMNQNITELGINGVRQPQRAMVVNAGLWLRRGRLVILDSCLASFVAVIRVPIR